MIPNKESKNMTISTLDAKSALLVVDLQKGIVAMPVAHPIAEVVNNAARLADAFRKRGLPVVLINVDGGAPGRTEQARRVTEFPAGWTDLIPELNRQPSDHIVTKRTWGAFANTDLDKISEAGRRHAGGGFRRCHHGRRRVHRASRPRTRL
jgi:nicotinamidase-related amidase